MSLFALSRVVGPKSLRIDQLNDDPQRTARQEEPIEAAKEATCRPAAPASNLVCQGSRAAF